MTCFFEEEYIEIIEKYSRVIDISSVADENNQIQGIIKKSLDDFLHRHKKVAIYCYGEHTRYLLAEYIYELRNVKYIVDNGNVEDGSGYKIIKDEQIEDYEIDGIIISTFQFRDDIKQIMNMRHPNVEYIDFYDNFADRGIKIEGPFYRVDSPFSRYESINRYRCNLEEDPVENYKNLIENYMAIQDFRLVFETAGILYGLTGETIWQEMEVDFRGLYDSFFRHLRGVKRAVLLLCMDAMRRASLNELEKTYPILKAKGKEFTNVYSYSTSTFESLYPVFLENTDQRTKYYDSNAVDVEKCRFTRSAIEKGRNIYIIGDGFAYFKGKNIKADSRWTTLTQKLYTFLVWAEKDPNGIFWVQPPYESHVSFISPYCAEPILIRPANVFFEFDNENAQLDERFGNQYNSSIRYIDDTLCEFVKNISCRAVFFSDHGDHNFIEFCKIKAKDINPLSFTAKEDNIRIPFILISPEEKCGERNEELHSLTELNDIVCAMLEEKAWKCKEKDYIKIGRTAIYNPKLKQIIKRVFRQEHGLLAFEGFIFKDGYKLLIFNDGKMELYKTDYESEIRNSDMVLKYYNMIKDDVTVCEVI